MTRITLDPTVAGYTLSAMATVPYSRTTSSGYRTSRKSWLTIGQKPVATVESFSGGDAFAEVVNEPGGHLPYAKKHLGQVRFADLVTEVAVDAHPSLHLWIREAWFGKPSRDRVVIETPDSSGTGTRGIQLEHARLRSITLPGLDSNSRERRYLTLGIAPRAVQRITGKVEVAAREEREFRAQHFHIDIEGLDCSGVLSVDPINVNLELPPDGERKSSVLVFPDLHLHLDAEKADSFREWFEDFVIGGNNDDERERDGAVTYLEPFGEALALLRLYHVGIYRITDEPAVGSGPPRVRVDLYVERMEFARMDTASGSTELGLKPIKI